MGQTTSDEVERLKAAQLEAEQRYVDAMERGDLSEARKVAVEWRTASNALTEYVMTKPDHYRDRG
jgi:hypothetical protein